MKNSDTFLLASVKIAVNSVFYAILRHSAQPTPETSAAEERRPGSKFPAFVCYSGVLPGYNFSYLAYTTVSVAEGLQRYCTSVESLVR